MQYGKVPGVDKPVSRLVMGTTGLSEDRTEQCFRLLDDIFALGINTFDTAAVYGGNGEGVLIRWMADRGIHDRAVLLTKGAHHNRWRRRVTPYDIMSDVSDTLAKPGADYIDIFMLHRDDESVPVASLIDVLNRLRDAGKLRSFGCSNWTLPRLLEANNYAERFGLAGFTSVSPHFSLAEQIADPWGENCQTLTGENDTARAASDFCTESQLPVFCYSSLCRGFFSGRFHGDDPAGAEAALDEPGRKGYLCPANLERLRRAEQLAAELKVTVAQVALAWVFCQPMNLFALVSASTGAHMKENLAALSLRLTPAQCAWLNLE